MRALFRKLNVGTEKYPTLTGVRAVGATVVFFDHFSPWPDQHLVVNVMAFFFALSGFLIVRIYHEQAQISLAWLTKYFVNRFARIYPVYFLLLTIAAWLDSESDPWVLFKNYTLTHALFHGETLVIEPSWSLTVEEGFYFLAPSFMLLARRYTFLAPCALASALLAAALAISRLGFAFLGTPGFVLSMTFFGHFVEFFAGMWLALRVLKLERMNSIDVPGYRRTAGGIVATGVLVAAMMFVYWHPGMRHEGWLLILLNNFLLPLPIALLYSGLIRERTVLSRLLSGRLAGLLGRSSYSFYLLHMLIVRHVAIPLLPESSHRLLQVTITLCATWIISVLLFTCYEEPVNLFIRKKFKSKERWVGLQATLFQVRP